VDEYLTPPLMYAGRILQRTVNGTETEMEEIVEMRHRHRWNK
jgi:hypothetical protein